MLKRHHLALSVYQDCYGVFTDLEVFSEYSLSFFELWRGEGQPGILVLSLILELWYVNDLRLGQLIHASKIYMTNKKSGAFV